MNKPVSQLDTIPEEISGQEFVPGSQIAIAMQGGGSHAAFCAGVLDVLLACRAVRKHLIGIGATSGAAHAAAIAWAWIHHGHTGKGRQMLHQFWRDMAAEPCEFFDWGANQLTQFLAGSSIKMDTSPYEPPASWWAEYGLDQLRRTLKAALPDGRLPHTSYPGTVPHLRIGAIEILTGQLRAISGVGATIEHLLASATLPEMFPAAQPRYGNQWDGTYWDGLFAMNPPIAALLDLPGALFPDEIWVVRVNPKIRDQVPRTPREIADRRNELSGNLSLEQEISQIRRINRIIEDNKTCKLVEKRPDGTTRTYKTIKVREIEMFGGQIGRSLDLASKLDRSPAFIEDLYTLGNAQAADFLTNLPTPVTT